MQTIYNSQIYVVVEIGSADGDARHGGFEIMDKTVGRGIFIDGTLAEHFRQGVQELMASEPTVEDIDAFLNRFGALMHQPLVLH